MRTYVEKKTKETAHEGRTLERPRKTGAAREQRGHGKPPQGGDDANLAGGKR